MSFRFDPDEWRPDEPSSYRKQSTQHLQLNTLIVWDRKPYRVVEVREMRYANWPEKYRDAWVQQGMPAPDTWTHRPRVLVLRHEEQPQKKPLHMLGPNSATWYVLPEHYAICRLCHELPPCRHVHNEAVMGRASERMAEEMAIMPGVCHGCREPITGRQKTFTFPGPNLIRPDLGNDSAIFHTRRDCIDAARSYDERWAAAEPGRSRLLFCEGTVTVHHEDSRECDSPDCKAKNTTKGLVRHRTGIWHRPQGSPTVQGCWCLAAAA